MPSRRQFLRMGLIGMLLIAVPFLITHVKLPLPKNDFIGYWTVGRLMMNQENPYNPEAVFQLEKEAGWAENEPLIMYTPPWTLPFLIPFGLLPFESGQMAWYLLQSAFLMGAIIWYWQLIQGPKKLFWAAILLGLFFWPSLYALQVTQITPIMLVGSVIFLWGVSRKNPTWKADLIAGLGASMLTVKPHSVYLFWIALLFWSVSKRRWFVLEGTAFGIFAGLGAALLINPLVINQYLGVFISNAPTEFSNIPTFGNWLRIILGGDLPDLQYISLIFGVGWFTWWWVKNSRLLAWPELFDAVMSVSLMTTIYTWSFDQVVLLPMILKSGLRAFDKKMVSVGAIWVTLMVVDLILHRVLLEYFSMWRIPAILILHNWISRKS